MAEPKRVCGAHGSVRVFLQEPGHEGKHDHELPERECVHDWYVDEDGERCLKCGQEAPE